MRKLILYYLYSILLIPISLHLIYGSLQEMTIHPGIIIHAFILLRLIYYFFQRINKSKLKSVITKIIISFIIVYFISLFGIEMVQFQGISIVQSIIYGSKIFEMLFLAFYIYENGDYFMSKIDKIILINVIVLLANVIIGYQFQIGGRSYGAVEDSFRGFLAGNDTSVFSFIAYGYALNLLLFTKSPTKRYLSFLLLGGAVYVMYIIATKAFFVAGLITILLISKLIKSKGQNTLRFALFLLIFIGFYLISNINFENRGFEQYQNQVYHGEKLMAETLDLPSSLKWLNNVAPGRIVVGISMIVFLFSSSILNIFFGFGISGIYEAFGEPPMMEILAILGQFGIVGFFVFYFPQLYFIIRLIKERIFNVATVLFIAVFLYGSLGGFLYGVSNTSTMYALLFAMSYYSYKNPKSPLLKFKGQELNKYVQH